MLTDMKRLKRVRTERRLIKSLNKQNTRKADTQKVPGGVIETALYMKLISRIKPAPSRIFHQSAPIMSTTAVADNETRGPGKSPGSTRTNANHKNQ